MSSAETERNPGLHNLPGPWRWEQRGRYWYRVNDRFGVADGPHDEPEHIDGGGIGG